MNLYLQPLKKYAVFTGRARRKEWWTFGVLYLVVLFALRSIDLRLGTFDHDIRFGLLSGFYLLATILPVVAVTVRRLHDTNRSGWWYFIIFVPLLGIILLVTFMAQDGQIGENRFGPDPKTHRIVDTTLRSSAF